jgi:hypothetical protein
MLDRFAALAHGLGVGVETLLHGFEQVLVLPPCDASLRPRRALRFERALGTRGGPVAPQNLAVFFVRVTIS